MFVDQPFSSFSGHAVLQFWPYFFHRMLFCTSFSSPFGFLSISSLILLCLHAPSVTRFPYTLIMLDDSRVENVSSRVFYKLQGQFHTSRVETACILRSLRKSGVNIARFKVFGNQKFTSFCGWRRGRFTNLNVPSIYQHFALLRWASCWSVAKIRWRLPCIWISAFKKPSGT